jgi:hypothetical protein
VLESTIYILFTSLLFFTILAWTPRNKPFMEERVFFSVFGMITAFVLGVGSITIETATGADALVTTTNTSFAFYWFGWGVVLLIRMLAIIGEIYREQTDPNIILDKEERESVMNA